MCPPCSCYYCADCEREFEYRAFKAGGSAALKCALCEHQHQCLRFGVKETAIVAHKRYD